MPNKIAYLLVRSFRHLLMNQRYILPLNVQTRNCYAAKLTAISHLKIKNRINSTKGLGNGIILIGGPSRVGKSRLAVKVSDKMEAPVISLDDFAIFFQNHSETTIELVKFEIMKVLCYYGENIIIEGVVLISNNFNYLWKNLEKYDLTISFLTRVKNQLSKNVFVIGASNINKEQKTKEIYKWAEKNRCWLVPKLTKDQMLVYSELTIEISIELKQRARECGYEYIDVGDNALDKAAEYIINQVA